LAYVSAKRLAAEQEPGGRMIAIFSMGERGKILKVHFEILNIFMLVFLAVVRLLLVRTK
jgi:hypothetical protein